LDHEHAHRELENAGTDLAHCKLMKQDAVA
jgi:hypothetical protein